jgi:DNA polymerase
MKELLIDIETFSEADIGSVGSFRYIDDPSFEVLLFAYKVDDEETKLVDLMNGETVPEEIVEAVYDPNVVKWAHNAAFERYALWKHFGRYLPPEQWKDTMILAAQCGLPLHLAGVCDALNMGEDKAKMKEGKALIKYFCCPCRPTKVNGQRTRNYPEHDPEKWEVFRQYCIRDVDSEVEVRDILIRYEPSEVEHRFWCLDARINENGMRSDIPFVKNALEMDAKYKAELTDAAIAVSGLDNPNSVSQIKEWLQEQEDLEVPSLNKKAVADVVANLKTDEAKQFMAIRTELSKTSTKKYNAFVRCASPNDSHVRGCFQFFGGHTGRFAGRLVQLQNLPQNHMPDLEEARDLVCSGDYETFKMLYPAVTPTLSELIRTSLVAEEGHRFVVADFSAIEARVSAWFAGEEWRLKVFREGGDIYCESASQMFKVPVVKNGINGELRQKGKVAELALGYGGGVNALKAFGADKMGMSNEEMAQTVDQWRAASPNIVAIWSSLDKAMKRCIVHRSTVLDTVAKVRFRWDHGIVWMRLPSGREMAYYAPEYSESKYTKGKMTISYMGVGQKTRKWERIETWGGRLFENLVQATARDCLRDTMMRLDADGWDIRGHVHDEVICSEPIGGRSVDEMCEVFARPIDWAPGLPLTGAGYECEFYKKD